MNIVPQSSQQLITAASLEQVDDAVRRFLRAQHAGNTRRAYVSDCRIFAEWCQFHGFETLPARPDTIARFLSAQAEAGHSTQTIVRRRAAIRWMHEANGHASPTLMPLVKQTMSGITREVGLAPRRQKAPLIDSQLSQLLACIDATTLAGIRDRALLLVGFGGALRRSELVGIHVEHLTWQPLGVTVRIPHSKTDQEGRGQTVPVLNGRHFKPVDALREWLAAAGIDSGPVFRAVTRTGKPRKAGLCDRAVANIIKHYATLAGIDPATVSGHSLRSGFVTSGVMHDANIFKIMDVTRHKNVQTVRTYARIAEQFKDHAGAGFM
ncbi:integrase [Xenophilus sp. AP218F]|nr:integrase [Xenophilus sp. AP218F]